MAARRVVYIIGAGFSAGLGFPTIANLLEAIWPRLEAAGLDAELADVVRFHHPSFNPALSDTYVNVEELLSEMKANEQRLIAEQQSRIALANQTEAMHQRQLAMENAEQANKMQMLAKTNEARAIANEQQAKQQRERQ